MTPMPMVRIGESSTIRGSEPLIDGMIEVRNSKTSGSRVSELGSEKICSRRLPQPLSVPIATRLVAVLLNRSTHGPKKSAESLTPWSWIS